MADTWTAVMNRLLSGLAHEVNGRAAALRGIAILATQGSPESARPLLALEAEQMERLAATLSALRLEPPEPLDVRYMAQEAGQVLALMHITLRIDVASTRGVLAVEAVRGELLRTLVLLAAQLVPPRLDGIVDCRITRRAGRVALELRCPQTAAPCAVDVQLPKATLSLLPDGYRLSLPALGNS